MSTFPHLLSKPVLLAFWEKFLSPKKWVPMPFVRSVEQKRPPPANFKISWRLAKTGCRPHVTMPHLQHPLFCSTKWARWCFSPHLLSALHMYIFLWSLTPAMLRPWFWILLYRPKTQVASSAVTNFKHRFKHRQADVPLVVSDTVHILLHYPFLS